MKVIGADGVHVGTVESVAGRRIRLTKEDSGLGSHKGHSHYLDEGLIAEVEGNDVRPVDLMKGAQREPDFLRISPNNKIPAIIDDDGPDGRATIFESGAILVYLAEKTGRLLPQAGRARSDTFQWLFWAMSAVGPGIGRFASVALFSKDPDGALVRSLAEEAVRLLTVLHTRLADLRFLTDSYSIADLGAFTWVDYIRQPLTKF